MRQLQDVRVFNHIAPISLQNATGAIANDIDTLGYGGGDLLIICTLGVTGGTFTALKVQESDDDSSYSDVSGTTVGTSTDIDGAATDLPDGTGDDAGTYIFHIPLTESRKRYFNVVATANNDGAMLFSCSAVLAAAGKVSVTDLTDASPADNTILRGS